MLSLECASSPALGFSNNKGHSTLEVTLNILIMVAVAWVGPGPVLFIRNPKLGSRPGRQRVILFQTRGHWASWIPTVLAYRGLMPGSPQDRSVFLPLPFPLQSTPHSIARGFFLRHKLGCTTALPRTLKLLRAACELQHGL